MSLGLGIFLSTLLLIAVWQIDKRGAWRKAGKGLLGFFALLVAIGAGWAGYLYWEDSSEVRARRALVAQLRSGQITKYWDIEAGMSQEDILYLKGEPSKRAEKDGDSRAQWSYDDSNNPPRSSYTVFWDERGKAAVIACASDDPFLDDCENIAGVGINDLESHVISTLGKPTQPPLIDKDGYKIMDYANLRLVLNKQRVEVLFFKLDNRNVKE